MSRQIDVKALVSHIVRGDGADKCRICMGDTSGGHVYLTDTVILDGDRPVTLLELLETITGIEVEDEEMLPKGICNDCLQEVLAALHFKRLCQQSQQHWINATYRLIKNPHENNGGSCYYLYDGNSFEYDGISCNEDEINAKDDTENDINTPCKCPDCGKAFRHLKSLEKHLEYTTKRVCPQCCKVFDKSEFAEHMAQEHHKTLIRCQSCNEIFYNEIDMKIHAHKHTIEGFETCEVCGVDFSNARALKTHKMLHASLYCKNCNNTFTSLKCLKYHERRCFIETIQENTMATYTCAHCGKNYTKKPSLRCHIWQKHVNVLPCMCNVCGKRFSTVTHLKSHKTTHLAVRNTYDCHCGAKLQTEWGYLLHQRIHTGEKPYECDQCGKKFLSSSRRSDHIKRIHVKSEDMPHSCEICPAGFVRPFQLRKHYLTVHRMEVEVIPGKRGRQL